MITVYIMALQEKRATGMTQWMCRKPGEGEFSPAVRLSEVTEEFRPIELDTADMPFSQRAAPYRGSSSVVDGG